MAAVVTAEDNVAQRFRVLKQKESVWMDAEQ
jgi:hypothetical protein